ncbi:hydantoinase/oxoprolinase family protein [Sporomusa acidovorans]|uniref:Acetophenone carboxylase gamma subunit n=1 Tax=Sporomusa acidovorans (strain ATCC 49682 / DSM 3132 / Mol) TaxID=1123286 RepID=A0ABZ3J0U2_SPOA4|nr:hydantoinase/oxoprolinase family protein [Sporomusa acidovorans]OZC21349.1 acetophenone carboxylase alpha subunit [Sporomusa acidovorans DSM 3132]SDE56636.1 Hydantoinase/oxoprolinase N-terminal region [Sporomusa acidovorans]
MLLGIDVGGTFTDAVVLEDGKVLASAKTPTTHGELLRGIIAVIDQVLDGINRVAIRRVALSTTIVTNALIEGRIDQVALLLLAGPGLNLEKLTPGEPHFLSGYTDHRGREKAAPVKEEVTELCRKLKGTQVAAVIGKFAVRNPQQEQQVADWVDKFLQPAHITKGAELSGSLNYLRRINSAYYNSAVWRVFTDFAAAIETAIIERGITAPVYILKADGGTLPLGSAKERPVEAIFTGPAASVLGIMALTNPEEPAVSLDIGGTTTDIALWQNGVPLLAPGGASVNGHPTAVRSFWLRSVGIGGDSYVRREQGRLLVGPMRRGPAMANGGPEPAVTDALRVAGLIDYGDLTLARKAMAGVATEGQAPEDAAWETVQLAADTVCRTIQAMLAEQAARPVYKVEDIVHGEAFIPELLIGVGGAAPGLAPVVAEKLSLPWQVPAGHMVANAIGAASARPTTEITLRADSAEGYYTVPELGIKQTVDKRHFSLAAAWEAAEGYLAERAAEGGMAENTIVSERVYEEEFNVIRGFNTMGKIMTCKLQIKPGVLTPVQAGEAGR